MTLSMEEANQQSQRRSGTGRRRKQQQQRHVQIRTTIVMILVALGVMLYLSSLVVLCVVWFADDASFRRMDESNKPLLQLPVVSIWNNETNADGINKEAGNDKIDASPPDDGNRKVPKDVTSGNSSKSFSTRNMKQKPAVNQGILSTKHPSFFRALQDEIDAMDPHGRCARYGGTFAKHNNESPRIRRRIFFGALIASEPRELLEIIAAEAHGIYTAMVLVESNRTQNFTPRPFQHYSVDRVSYTNATADLAYLFGIRNASMVQLRAFVNEDATLLELDREHAQRAEILQGWRDLGMQGDDIGLLADLDESFTRDVLLAVQECNAVDTFGGALDYEHHFCHFEKVKLRAYTRIFEASPFCSPSSKMQLQTTNTLAPRFWYHPDMIIGHCIEGIGNATRHGLAPRTVYNHKQHLFLRAPGYGQLCNNDWKLQRRAAALNGGYFPLWNAADFRRTCSGRLLKVRNEATNSTGTISSSGNSSSTNSVKVHEQQLEPQLDGFTAFHLHNFFASAQSLRFKYQTYGHPLADAQDIALANLTRDVQFTYQCVMDDSYAAERHVSKGLSYSQADQVAADGDRHVLLQRGYAQLKPFLPIYFYDEDYRHRRHAYVKNMLLDSASTQL